ncbi:MAG: hypothetical protein WBN70_02740 [Polyangiales bacterium]
MRTYEILIPRLSQSSKSARSEWASLFDMLPASVGLFSPGNMARQGIELLSNAANTRRFDSVLASAQSHLRDASVPVLINHRDPPSLTSPDELSRSQRRWLGQLALELYFTQIFRSKVAVVDLWPSRFGVDEAGDAVWSPRPFYLRWDARFREGLRDVYAGFFLNDRVQFEHGVFELGLNGSADVLVQHFGEGNQRSVRFGAAELSKTLLGMSKQRHSNDQPLHPNFIAFGLYLVALHELLESLDMSFDVRAAFMRSYPGRSQR